VAADYESRHDCVRNQAFDLKNSSLTTFSYLFASTLITPAQSSKPLKDVNCAFFDFRTML